MPISLNADQDDSMDIELLLLLRAGEVSVYQRAGRRIVSFEHTARFRRRGSEECGPDADVLVTGEVSLVDAQATDG